MSMVEFYVSPAGDDRWSGSMPEPNEKGTDGPFATLERARDAVRELERRSGPPPGGVTVRARGGDYVRDGTFELAREDSGTEGSPIVYRASEGERPRLLGGRAVSGFESVEDPTVLERLSPGAREHVVQADLAALGITDFGRLRSRGFGREVAPAHMELFFKGGPMTLARWPNDGFCTIAGIPEASAKGDEHGGTLGELEAGFHYEGDRPERWKGVTDVWMYGYWAWDWAGSYEKIASMDTAARLVLTEPPHGLYGFRTGQRFYFLNLLEELDSPGEYYVDVRRGILYFWPPEPVEGAEALVSVLETPMIAMRDCSHVTVQGLTFECTRGTAIRITGGSGNLIAGCTIRNIGSQAVEVRGGEGHGVAGCDISHVGDGGIVLTGGDRKTLTPCGHFAHNNHIHHFARWSKCYRPAVSVTGVGVRVSHNLIHDAPHSAIIYLGNENLIEKNEIHRVTLETGDCGAIYTGRDFTARGNVIRHNYVHDTGNVKPGGSMAVYLDDCASGQTVFGNVFRSVSRAAFIGGGRDNVVENNVFLDCEPAVMVDGRGLNESLVWHNMVYRTMKESLEAMKPHEPPYSERYPELQDLDAYYAKDDGVPPEGNVIARNVCAGGTWLVVHWHAEEKHLTIKDNLVAPDPGFVDAEHNDFRLSDDSPARGLGFEPIPAEEIGLRLDEFRDSLPGEG